MGFTKGQIFCIKYFFPLITLILTLVAIGQYYTSILTETDLVTTTGKVVNIKQDKYHHYKYIDDRITITLENQTQPFYFFGDSLEFFPILMTNIRKGDSIMLYHRTKLQAKIGTGSEFKIMQIKKGTLILYSFNRAKADFSLTGGFTLYAAIVMWIVYFLLLIKVKQDKSSA